MHCTGELLQRIAGHLVVAIRREVGLGQGFEATHASRSSVPSK